MISVKLVQTDAGPEAVVMIGNQVATTPVENIRLAGGVLHLALPAYIEAPEGCTVIERPVEPTMEQVRLTIEAIRDPDLEEALSHMTATMPADTSWPQIVKAAIGLLIAPGMER